MAKAPAKIHKCTYCEDYQGSPRGLKIHMGRKHPDKKQGGRPPAITEDKRKALLHAFSFGATDAEACQHVDISTATLYNYQNKNPEFLDKKDRLKTRPAFIARTNMTRVMQETEKKTVKYRNEQGDLVEKIVDRPTDRAMRYGWDYLQSKYPREFSGNPDIAIQNNVLILNDDKQSQIVNSVRNWAETE